MSETKQENKNLARLKKIQGMIEKVIESINLDGISKENIGELRGFATEHAADFIKLNPTLDDKTLITELEKDLKPRIKVSVEAIKFQQEQEGVFPEAIVKKGFKSFYKEDGKELFAKANGEVLIYSGQENVTKLFYQTGAIKQAIKNFAIGMELKDGIKHQTISTNLSNVLNRLGFGLLSGQTTNVAGGAIESVIGFKKIKTTTATEGETTQVIFCTIDMVAGAEKVSTISTFVVDHREAIEIKKVFEKDGFFDTEKGGL